MLPILHPIELLDLSYRGESLPESLISLRRIPWRAWSQILIPLAGDVAVVQLAFAVRLLPEIVVRSSGQAVRM